MAELQKEKEISQNCFGKEKENFDKNTKIKNRNTGQLYYLKNLSDTLIL